MSKVRLIRRTLSVFVILGATTFSGGGCIPSGLGRDLVTSTASAIVGDVVFTLLDLVLPRPM